MKMINLIKDVNESLARQKQLISNTDYIDWLYDFTEAHPKFSSDQWDYDSPKSIFDDDYEKVGMVTDFFTAIKQYCTKNSIASLGTSHVFSYTIKYEDKYFEIGVRIGQRAFTYVAASDATTSEYILFESVMNDSKDYKLDIRMQKLSELKEVTEQLKEVGTPLDIVLKTVKDIYK